MVRGPHVWLTEYIPLMRRVIGPRAGVSPESRTRLQAGSRRDVGRAGDVLKDGTDPFRAALLKEDRQLTCLAQPSKVEKPFDERLTVHSEETVIKGC